jgi:hypothetical protein
MDVTFGIDRRDHMTDTTATYQELMAVIDATLTTEQQEHDLPAVESGADMILSAIEAFVARHLDKWRAIQHAVYETGISDEMVGRVEIAVDLRGIHDRLAAALGALECICNSVIDGKGVDRLTDPYRTYVLGEHFGQHTAATLLGVAQ